MSFKKYVLLNLSDYDSFSGFDFYITLFLWLLTACLCVGVFIMNTRKNNTVRIVKQILRHGARTEEQAKTLSDLGLDASFGTRRLLSDGTRMSRFVKRAGAKPVTYEEYIQSLKKKKKRPTRAASMSARDIRAQKLAGNISADSEATGVGNPTDAIGDAMRSDKPNTTNEACDTPNVELSSASNKEGEEKSSSIFEIDFDTARFYIPKENELDIKQVMSKRETSLWQSALECVFLISLSICLTFLLPLILSALDKLL